jgi:uroporphyrin-III C-methyltransferase
MDLASLALGLEQSHGPVLVMVGNAMARRPHQAPDRASAQVELAGIDA